MRPSRVVIDAQLADRGWKTQEANSVRYEYVLPDGTRADYVLCDRHGRSIAAERIVIDSYREMIGNLGLDDPTTRRMMEEILAMEEEHADAPVSLLEELGSDG
ncbi:MAG: hypothetical protein ACHBMF_03940 [Chromatiales bacterium]